MPQEPDISKGKKRRKRSARVYINVHKPVNPEAAALIGEFPSDEDDDGPTPGHSEARARNRAMCEEAEVDKSMPGNPVEPGRGRSLTQARVSEPLTAGHASPSAADHGVGQGRAAEIAVGHSTMRQQQSPASFDDIWTRLRTARGNVADLGFGPDSRLPGGFSHAGEVGLRLFDAAGAAGRYQGRNPVDANPYRPDAHQHRDSATPPNGSHSTAYPTVPPRQSMKASEAREVLKRFMFGGNGAR